jgi:hypothetical protein
MIYCDMERAGDSWKCAKCGEIAYGASAPVLLCKLNPKPIAPIASPIGSPIASPVGLPKPFPRKTIADLKREGKTDAEIRALLPRGKCCGKK